MSSIRIDGTQPASSTVITMSKRSSPLRFLVLLSTRLGIVRSGLVYHISLPLRPAKRMPPPRLVRPRRTTRLLTNRLSNEGLRQAAPVAARDNGVSAPSLRQFRRGQRVIF